MSQSLILKGIRDGLLLTLDDSEWEQEALPGLLARIDQNRDFFRGARLTLQLGSRALSAAELGRLRDVLSDRDVSLWCVLTDSASTLDSARALGLETSLPSPAPSVEAESAFDTGVGGEEAVLVRRTLRSGNRVQFSGHVVVLGDVNPGAEIVAGGNVIVWGRLRGVVHAGAAGDNSAIVCALDLLPTQLRIGEHIAVSPERRGPPAPEMAKVRDGRLIAERWNVAKE